MAHKLQTAAIHEGFNENKEVVSFEKLQQLPKGKQYSPETLCDVAEMQRTGYVIIQDLLCPAKLQETREALEPYLSKTGRNIFEGLKTQRVYGLLGKSRAFDEIAMHPRILDILDHFLLPKPLITAFQAIKILPGETHQPFHHDDQFMNLPRPHRAFSIGTIWAIDEFTETNGSTLIFPGSHKWGTEKPNAIEAIKAVMPAGSVLVFQSTLWHGGGGNTSAATPRLAISTQYCEPWIRPQENQILAVPFSIAQNLHPTLQSLMGYGIHPPFIGHANGVHPLVRLEEINQSSKL